VCSLHSCEATVRLDPNLPAQQVARVQVSALVGPAGFAGYAGEQDNDPRANSDCATAEPAAASQTTHVDEFQVFSR
jgi:hypothetical protein